MVLLPSYLKFRNAMCENSSSACRGNPWGNFIGIKVDGWSSIVNCSLNNFILNCLPPPFYVNCPSDVSRRSFRPNALQDVEE